MTDDIRRGLGTLITRHLGEGSWRTGSLSAPPGDSSDNAVPMRDERAPDITGNCLTRRAQTCQLPAGIRHRRQDERPAASVLPESHRGAAPGFPVSGTHGQFCPAAGRATSSARPIARALASALRTGHYRRHDAGQLTQVVTHHAQITAGRTAAGQRIGIEFAPDPGAALAGNLVDQPAV